MMHLSLNIIQQRLSAAGSNMKNRLVTGFQKTREQAKIFTTWAMPKLRSGWNKTKQWLKKLWRKLMEAMKKLWGLVTYPFQPSGITPNPVNSSTAKAVRDPAASLNVTVILALVGWLVLVILRWAFNAWDLNWVVAIIGGLSFWATLVAGLRVTNIAASSVFGAITALFFDKDVSQGAGLGPIWLFKLVRNIAFLDLLITFTLMTWSFAALPQAFWVLFAGVIIIQMVSAIWKLQTGKVAPYLIVGYAAVCIAVGMWGTLGDAYNGKFFDPNTGEATLMVDPVTGFIDSNGRTPADCKATPCFSAETGERLVPMTKEQALNRNPAAKATQLPDEIAGANLNVWQIGVVLLAGLILLSLLSKVSTKSSVKNWLVIGMMSVLVIWLASVLFQMSKDVEITAFSPSMTKPVAGSEDYTIPAEGKLVIVPPGTKYFTVQVPRDSVSFCNYNADGTVDEIARGSWQDTFSHGPLVGNKIVFKVNRDLTGDYRFYIEPRACT